MTFATVTGYYRYTDIWFAWPSRCGEYEEVLKAMLGNRSYDSCTLRLLIYHQAHDALVSPDHPLHVDGVDGAQLYIVDYVRYYLHKVGLTEKLVPLPYSNCLIREQDLRGVSTQVFRTGGELKKNFKKIDKFSKGLKNSDDPPLAFRRSCFEKARMLWQGKTGAWCSIDIEAWEMDHRLITEFGWSTIHWEEGTEVQGGGHLIVKEYETYRNGKYVADNQKNYQWGKSEIVPKKQFKTQIQMLLTDLKRQFSHLFMVFHVAKGDIEYLNSSMIEANLNDLSYTLPDGTSPQPGVYVVDTAELFGGLIGQGNDNRSLEQMCNQLQLQPDFYTMLFTLAACQSMASGATVDMQREERWPNKTEKGQ
ncbi:hypothetical protein BDP27DRAFT_1312511 [Rhodocollybia butyracea]|uniref:Gfd2/YDR514C-like C-terminal domain-containing protein n=1 Tax=Rhodocollybia butyracea TaxID=206335 RepID=A0A9P5UEZ8_9AGAR|nr:hypothetical protein BDP27DRAFT_1312511 [Rhodocollybia butyracea]